MKRQRERWQCPRCGATGWKFDGVEPACGFCEAAKGRLLQAADDLIELGKDIDSSTKPIEPEKP